MERDNHVSNTAFMIMFVSNNSHYTSIPEFVVWFTEITSSQNQKINACKKTYKTEKTMSVLGGARERANRGRNILEMYWKYIVV